MSKPSFLTRWVLGPLCMFTAIITPLSLMTDPTREPSLVAMGSIMVVGVLFGLGLMWPDRLGWARRVGVGGCGVLLLWFAFWIWSGVQDMETVTTAMRIKSWAVFAMPSCVAAVTLFFAFTGRWPWFYANGEFIGMDVLASMRGAEPAAEAGRRPAGGADGRAEGVWARVDIRGAGTRRIGWVYAILVMPASALIFVSDLRRAEFLAAQPLRSLVFGVSAVMGLAALVLYLKVIRKPVTWTVGADGLRRTGQGTEELHLTWDQLVAAKASSQTFGFETLSLRIKAKDGRSWDLTWTKDKSATDHEFARLCQLVVGQVGSSR